MGHGGPKTEPVDGGAAARRLPERIAATFLNDCAPDVAARVVPRLRPQPLKPIATPVTRSEGFERIPRTDALCPLDMAIAPPLQRLMAERSGLDAVLTLAAGHEPFFSHPQRPSDVLAEAAAAA